MDEKLTFFEDIMNSNVKEDSDYNNNYYLEDEKDVSISDEYDDIKGIIWYSNMADSKRGGVTNAKNSVSKASWEANNNNISNLDDTEDKSDEFYANN